MLAGGFFTCPKCKSIFLTPAEHNDQSVCPVCRWHILQFTKSTTKLLQSVPAADVERKETHE